MLLKFVTKTVLSWLRPAKTVWTTM